MLLNIQTLIVCVRKTNYQPSFVKSIAYVASGDHHSVIKCRTVKVMATRPYYIRAISRN